MYLSQYLVRRVSTWYNDKFYQQFSNLEDITFNMNAEYIKECLVNKVFYQMHYSDLRNNISYLKFRNFDNLWIKIIFKNEINLEIITYINEVETPIFKEKEINHELFYKLITLNYRVKRNDEKLSNWKKRELNYNALYYFVQDKDSFDLKSFKANSKIEINIVKLKEFKDQLINSQKNKLLFYKAFENNEYTHLLNQYSLFFEGFNKITDNNYFLNLFENYSINSNHIDLLNIRNNKEIINNVIEHTEYVFTYEKHKESYYYENLIKQIEDKNLNTYFMFLRLSILKKMNEIPMEVIQLIDDNMLMDYDKISIAISEIHKNQNLFHSFIYINDYKKIIEINYFDNDFNHEDLKRVLYYCIRMGTNSPQNEINNNLGNTILNLIKTNVLSVSGMEEAMLHINNFNSENNLKKLKLKFKLENKLKIKSKKSKIEKI